MTLYNHRVVLLILNNIRYYYAQTTITNTKNKIDWLTVGPARSNEHDAKIDAHTNAQLLKQKCQLDPKLTLLE